MSEAAGAEFRTAEAIDYISGSLIVSDNLLEV